MSDIVFGAGVYCRYQNSGLVCADMELFSTFDKAQAQIFEYINDPEWDWDEHKGFTEYRVEVMAIDMPNDDNFMGVYVAYSRDGTVLFNTMGEEYKK